MSHEIERADLADLTELNAISFAAKSHWDYPNEWLELWREDLKLTPEEIALRKVYKLIEQHRIVGFCAIFETQDEYEVEHLWILPAVMGKGYGKQLLDFALADAIREDKPVIVASDPHAEGFYQKQGFETFAQRPSVPEGRVLPLMRRVGVCKPE